MPRKPNYKRKAKQLIKSKLPPLLPEWKCNVVLVKEVKDTWGECDFNNKIITIFIPENGTFLFKDKWGRVFNFEGGFSLIYCHEWFHSLYERREFQYAFEKTAEKFAMAWCKANDIIF